MRRFIIQFSIFTAFCLPAYLLFVIVWSIAAPADFLKKNVNYMVGSNGHMFSRIAEVKNTKDVDILFVGSSHAYRGFDTRVYTAQGFTAFNLGSSAQTPVQSEILLKRYLDQLNPKIVVFEMYPGTFENDGVESSLDLIANAGNSFDTFIMLFTINHIKTYNTFIYGCFRDIFKLNQGYKEEPIKDVDTYIPGGYVQRNMHIFDGKEIFEQNKKWLFEEYQLEAFDRILNMLQSRNINYLLAFAPINSELYSMYTNNEEVDEMYKQFGPYINFNGILELDNHNDFYDSHHLNQNGVLKFNEALVKRLPLFIDK